MTHLQSYRNYDFYQDSSRESGDEFYKRMGRFFASRAIQNELGGAMYDDEKYTWIIIKKGEEVIGWGAVIDQGKGKCFFDWCYIVPDHRKQGLYAQMFSLREGIATHLGAKTLRTATRSKDLKATLTKKGFSIWQERGEWTYYQKEVA